MSALPANLGQEDSLDSERILRVLPDRERETMARICEDPYDRLFSLAVRDEDPRERMAELGDAGFIQFTVDESAGLVRVYDLVWIG